MAETREEQEAPPQPPIITSSNLLIIRLMSKRRTWVALFVVVYTLLLSSTWNIINSILSWYESSAAAPSPPSSGWPALYAAVGLGAVFGLLSMAAALAVAVPAMMVTWITVLVLLAFCGKPRRALVVEGRKLTAEIVRFVAKILIREGNFVAAVCAVVGYFLLVRRRREEIGDAVS